MFATTAQSRIALADCEFQSLSGVLGVCNMVFRIGEIDYGLLFQSLSGVLGVCNVYIGAGQRSADACFNPFQGF